MVLKALEYFGESALIGSSTQSREGGRKRNASVTVSSDSASLLKLETAVFEKLMEENVMDLTSAITSAIDHAKELFVARANVRYSQTLQNVQLFTDLDQESIGKIIEVMNVRTYRKGDQLCCQGDAALELMVLLTGSCSVAVNGREVRTFQRLDVLGEPALMEQNQNRVTKRGATVTATSSEVDVLVLSKDKYMDLLKDGCISMEMHQKTESVGVAYSNEDAARLNNKNT